ncbi:MAG: hypothetical protein JOZ76_13585, partial [Bradyrhizobium sp.]|nr:hypothetical protein [Bradyrhizobium sp.]
EAGLIGQLAGIDLEGAALAGAAQIPPVGGIAEQRFVAALDPSLTVGFENSCVVGFL